MSVTAMHIFWVLGFTCDLVAPKKNTHFHFSYTFDLVISCKFLVKSSDLKMFTKIVENSRRVDNSCFPSRILQIKHAWKHIDTLIPRRFRLKRSTLAHLSRKHAENEYWKLSGKSKSFFSLYTCNRYFSSVWITRSIDLFNQ